MIAYQRGYFMIYYVVVGVSNVFVSVVPVCLGMNEYLAAVREVNL